MTITSMNLKKFRNEFFVLPTTHRGGIKKVCIKNLGEKMDTQKDKDLEEYFNAVEQCRQLHIEIAKLHQQIQLRKELLRHYEEILKKHTDL
jgi:hypothetical protein